MAFSSDPASQINQLPISIELSKDNPEKFHEQLINWMKNVANSVNSKEGGLHNLQELISSKQFYKVDDVNNFRNSYRMTYDLVQLNNGIIGASATVSFPHNIKQLKYATLIYAGCTSETPTFFSVMGQPQLYLDSVNLNFTNPIAVPLTSVIVVAEYLKN